MTQKCSSWRGHMFESRYDKSEKPNPLKVDVVHMTESFAMASLHAMKLSFTTYRGDICVRCGLTIPPSSPQGAPCP